MKSEDIKALLSEIGSSPRSRNRSKWVTWDDLLDVLETALKIAAARELQEGWDAMGPDL